MFDIRMGVPEMEALWNDLSGRKDKGSLNKGEEAFFKKWTKAMGYLRVNPRHPGLNTHEISDLTKRYGVKVWQSYLENNKPGAQRMFWVYGPREKEITVIGIEPHPEDEKRGAYDRVKLSHFPSKKPTRG